MTRYEAYAEKHWEDQGLAHLLVARTREDGSTDYAVFLVDLFCLGVKDAFFEAGVTEAELREFVDQRLPEDFRERFHPACARKLIEGALTYAESLGFTPHRDFRKARKVLSGIDASACPREFTYGRDGRPCYIRGSDDTDERVDRICAILEARCGAEGFDYEDPGAEDEDAALGMRDDLMDWLEAEPVEVPGFYEVSGLVTAMQLCPEVLMPAKLLEVLWGPEGRKWENQEEAREFMTLLMNYWNEVAGLIAGTVDPAAPAEETCVDIWEDDFEPDNGVGLIVALRAWAAGFTRATEIWPLAWGETPSWPDLAPYWEFLRCFAQYEQPGTVARLEQMAAETPPRNFGRSVAAIARALRSSRRTPG